MSEYLLEEEKQFDINNSISKLKESIHSNMIKKMLIDEDLKFKNAKVIDTKSKSKENKKTRTNNKNIINKNKINKNKIKKENTNEEINSKINKNKVKKENINDRDNKLIIQKVKPKSKTINNLMNENNNKIILKSIPKKKLANNKNESKKKILEKRKKSTSFSKKNNNKIKSKIDNTTNLTNLTSNSKSNSNMSKLNIKNKIRKESFSPKKEQTNPIYTQPNKDIKIKISHSEEKTDRTKSKISLDNESITNQKQNNKLKSIKKPKVEINKKESILKEINNNINNIINPNNTFSEKTVQDFSLFLESNNFEENPKIKNTLNIFKKGNKFIKKYMHLPIYHHYSNNEIIKDIIFKDILSFLLPYERYLFAKTNRESLIKYMKLKGSETEYLLDKYNLQKEIIEKALNKNKNIKITKNNFFKNDKLLQIFKLLNNEIYLEIFNDKTNTPNDNIIFVYKLFFLLIKNTDKLIQLKNNDFWEKICNYFINHTNEFNQSDLLLGDLIKKLMEQKLNFSDENIKKIYEIVNQIDIRQIKPITFSKISPTTSQFCYIIEYYLEFFGIIENEWNPLENEYIMIQHKTKHLIKKINKIGMYIVKLKYKNNNKEAESNKI